MREAMKGIKVNDVEWLVPSSVKGKAASLPPSSHIARTKQVQKILYLFYASLAIPLLRSTFYVTETEFQRGAIFFYRKPVWSKIRDLAMVGFGEEDPKNTNNDATAEDNDVETEETTFSAAGFGDEDSPPPPIKGQYKLVSKDEILDRINSQACGASQVSPQRERG